MAQHRPNCISQATKTHERHKNQELDKEKNIYSRAFKTLDKIPNGMVAQGKDSLEQPSRNLSASNNTVSSLTQMKSFASKIKKKVVFDKISRFCQEQTNKIFCKKGKQPSANNNIDTSIDNIVEQTIEDRMLLLSKGASFSTTKTRECSDEAGDKFPVNQSNFRAQYKPNQSSFGSFRNSRQYHTTTALTHRSFLSNGSMRDFNNSEIVQVNKEIQTLSPSFLNSYLKKMIFRKHNTRDSETQSTPTKVKPGYIIPPLPTVPRALMSQASADISKDSYRPASATKAPISIDSLRPGAGRHLYEPKLLSVDGIKVPVKSRNAVMNWEDYHRLDVIYSFLHNLEDQHPTYCSVFNIGNTIENRDIELIAVSNSNAKNHSVWLDAGIHGREWIAPAVCTYIIDQLCKNFKNQPKYITNKDWYIVPVLNPDGYEYSHTRNRMWRKNRSRYKDMIGVDLNRNFSEGWKDTYDRPGYASTNYGGPEPFSEVESMAVRDMLLNNGIKYSIYISLHCYGQMVMFPYSYKPELCENYIHLLEGATHMCKSIYETSGRNYKAGLSLDVMHGAHGTSTDWAYEVAKVPFCYTIELRNKVHRFHLPADQIVDCGKEIMSSIWALMKYFDDKGCALVNHNAKSPRYKYSNPKPISKFNK